MADLLFFLFFAFVCTYVIYSSSPIYMEDCIKWVLWNFDFLYNWVAVPSILNFTNFKLGQQLPHLVRI